MENRDYSTQQASQEAPVEDGYVEYEQPSKKAKVQSKVWHEYKKIKGTTPAENKAKCKHCQLCWVLIVDMGLHILNTI